MNIHSDQELERADGVLTSRARKSSDAERTREALLQAADDLLEGRVPGPLTGVRLVEIAGVKRHRLTHDNPDINLDFQERARVINRHKPEVDKLRSALASEEERTSLLVAENEALKTRINNYAAAILALTEERDLLRNRANTPENVTHISRRD